MLEDSTVIGTLSNSGFGVTTLFYLSRSLATKLPQSPLAAIFVTPLDSYFQPCKYSYYIKAIISVNVCINVCPFCFIIMIIMYVIVYIKINFIWPLRSLIFLWKTWYFFRSLWLNMIFLFNASFLKSIKYNLLNYVIVYIKNNFIWHLYCLLFVCFNENYKFYNYIYIVVFKWAFSTVVLIIKMFYGLK